ncbi:MAG: hypothetical protein QGH60_03970 [Phycisphaerae bacterium]|jgi:hypothetical protein|nr:hypothetical protein [Phycisphaerae bacterium]
MGKAEALTVTQTPDRKLSEVQAFVSGMTGEERMLVVLKKELYEGSWDEMLADLQARLNNKPYIFKLANRITDDIDRIERLDKFEQDNNVDLGDHIELKP